MPNNAQLDNEYPIKHQHQDPRFVQIIDVTLRDGLQAIGQETFDLISTDQKVAWLQRLVNCGFTSLEVTNFASPRRLPQFADAVQVTQTLVDLYPTIDIRGYVPNLQGLTRALEAGLPHAVFFTVCSETYELRNVGRTRQDSYQEIREMVEICMDQGVAMSCGIGMAFNCPYEGVINPSKVRETVEYLLSLGIRQITIADSLGIAGPREVAGVMEVLEDVIASTEVNLGLHLHNSLGIATATMLTALESGVRTFETTTTGIGGGIAMPGGAGFVPNLSTEAALSLLDDLQYVTGINRQAHAELADEIDRTFAELQPVNNATTVNWQTMKL
jgi:hydroxymethylglutaryl-CoA lyase